MGERIYTKEEFLYVKSEIFDQMVNPIVMFDAQDRLALYNMSAEEKLGVYEEMSLSDFVGETNLKLILTPERRMQGKTREFSLAAYMNDRIYLIHGKERWTAEEVYQGVFLTYDDITDQERMKDEATFYATHDKLTGLWNRDYFIEIAESTLREHPDEKFLMVASDIGQFKLFNDILGRQNGDKLLITLANGFHEKKKENWVCSRIAGDRFALLIPEKDFDDEKCLKLMHLYFAQEDYKLTMHNYIGVYKIADNTIGAEKMYDRAYMALESIKGNVQKEIAYYDSKIRERRLADKLTIDELECAMKEKQFVIFVQPQMDSVTGKVIGGEALVRWLSPRRGLVPPSEFIPIFEHNGMITRLDYHVWELACQLLAKWKSEGRLERNLSVNISPKDFYMTNLYELITGLVEKYQISPANLRLEITETAFVLDVQEQMSLVKRLQDYGFIIEMDDFGCGYSSLNSLKDIDVDVLKLDMKFFEQSQNPVRSRKIIESIISMAKNLDMPVIAEGVEEAGQVQMLREVGCPFIQGYYYSKPLSVEQYEAYIQDRESEDILSFINKTKE